MPPAKAMLISLFLTAEELCYDREVLQEAYEKQFRGDACVCNYFVAVIAHDISPFCYTANDELERARYRGHVHYGSSSDSDSSDEIPYMLRGTAPFLPLYPSDHTCTDITGINLRLNDPNRLLPSPQL